MARLHKKSPPRFSQRGGDTVAEEFYPDGMQNQPVVLQLLPAESLYHVMPLDASMSCAGL